MRTFTCSCGSTVFFENNQCVNCGSELGWCPPCGAIRSIVLDNNGRYRCTDPACGTVLVKCHNYAVEHVCNRCCVHDETAVVSHPLCDYCRYNETIPDLTIEENREKWHRLEIAKRRLLYTIDLLKLPYGNTDDGVDPPLSFDFKGDVEEQRKWWWAMNKEERVYTGHAMGKITINIREADHVEREKARVSFEEAHRTVIGHFRHEMGHYYWDLLVKGQRENDFNVRFGDPYNPNYGDALTHYYKNGPPAEWRRSYISAYATMHPWEDFAETFATYLDMVSVLDTAHNMAMVESLDPITSSLDAMIDHYARLGVVLNEMNRAMGLLDLVPETLVGPIVDKLRFVHDLLRDAGNRTLQH